MRTRSIVVPLALSLCSIQALAQSRRVPVAANRGYLGVVVEGERASPPRIVEVEAGSPASKAGLRQGDIVLRFDQSRAGDVDGFISKVAAAGAGKRVALTIRRAAREMRVLVVLTMHPDAAAAKRRASVAAQRRKALAAQKKADADKKKADAAKRRSEVARAKAVAAAKAEAARRQKAAKAREAAAQIAADKAARIAFAKAAAVKADKEKKRAMDAVATRGRQAAKPGRAFLGVTLGTAGDQRVRLSAISKGSEKPPLQSPTIM